MYQMLRLTIVVMAVVFANLPTNAPARVAVTQIKLTEKHVEGFIAAQKGMSAVVEKMMPGAVFSSSANARYEAELKAITKKHGFKNFAEYEAVAASISLVMAAIDSQTKVFTNPPTAIQQELEDVTAAKNYSEQRKEKIASEPHFGAEGGATYPISDQRRARTEILRQDRCDDHRHLRRLWLAEFKRRAHNQRLTLLAVLAGTRSDRRCLVERSGFVAVRPRSFSPWSSALHPGRSASGFYRSTNVPDVAVPHCIL